MTPQTAGTSFRGPDRGSALSEQSLADLAAFADRIDEWAKADAPQNVEWAIDSEDGTLAVLQSRPLH